MLEKSIAYLLDTVISKAKYNEQTREYQIKEEDYINLELSNEELELLKIMCKNSGIKLEYTEKTLPSIIDEELFQEYNDIQIKIATSQNPEEVKKLEQRRIEIRNKIFLDNMELVRTIINKEMDGIRDTKDKDDLYQLGYEVLLEFIDSHNITTKEIFTTYIEKHLLEYLNQKLSTINPETDQMTKDEQSRISMYSRNITSLSDDTLEDYIFYKMQQEYIMKIIDTLPTENQRLIIILLFGLNNQPEHTLIEMMERTGTTRNNIEQIIATALNYLKNPLRSKYLYQYALDRDLTNFPSSDLENTIDTKRRAFKQLELFLIKYLKQEELSEIIESMSRQCQIEVLVYFKLNEELNKKRQQKSWQNYDFTHAFLKENGLDIFRKQLETRHINNQINENITNYFDYLMHNYLTKTRKRH